MRLEVPRDSARACGVVTDVDGHVTAAATGIEPDGEQGRTYLSTRTPGGRFERTIDFAQECNTMVRSGPRRAMLLVGDRVIEVTRDGRVRGVLRNAGEELAANLRGATVVARLEQIGRTADDPWRLRAKLRTHGGRPFGRVLTLARPQIDPEAHPLDVAVGPRGDVAVVWANTDQETQRGSIFARVRPAGGRRFGRTLRIGPSGGFPAVASAFTSSGRLYVVWATSRRSRPDERFAIRATSVAPASRRVQRLRTLDAGRTFKGHLARTEVVATLEGGAVAAWNAARRSDPRVDITPLRVASAGSNGSFGSKQTLASNGELDDLAVAERTGSVVATWTTPDPDITGTIMSAIGSSQGRFGTTETVSGPGSFGGQATFDPAGAAVTSIWTHWVDNGNPEPPIEVQLADRPHPAN